MKYADVGSSSPNYYYGQGHFYAGCYFDGHHFATSSPTSGSPNVILYRDNAELIVKTSTNSASYATYGYPNSIIRIYDSKLFWGYTYYNGTSYYVGVVVFTAYNTYTSYTESFSGNFKKIIDVMYYNTYPTVAYQFVSSVNVVRFTYWTNSTTSADYSPGIDLSILSVTTAKGGWSTGSGNWYYVISDGGVTKLLVHTFYGGGSAGTLVYQICDTEIVSATVDQALYLHHDTFLFITASKIYRGKYTMANSFVPVLSGATEIGVYTDTDNDIVGLMVLRTTTCYFYKMFYGGAFEAYPTTVTSCTYVKHHSTRGWHCYYSGAYRYFSETFSTYTPTQQDCMTVPWMGAPSYQCTPDKGTTYNTSLIVADDSNNLIFAGRLIESMDNNANTYYINNYRSQIYDDLQTKIYIEFSAVTADAMIEQVCAEYCSQLTTDGGTLSSEVTTYTQNFHNVTVFQFFQWIHKRTLQMPRWNGVGIITYNDTYPDVGYDLTEVDGNGKIIAEFNVTKKTESFGTVLLKCYDFYVSASVDEGGTAIFFDNMPQITDTAEGQEIANNIASALGNAFTHIMTRIYTTTLPDIGDTVDINYENIDDNYYIIGFKWMPYTNEVETECVNALLLSEPIQNQSGSDIQTEENTYQITQVGGTSGLTNPLVSDLDANGYKIYDVGNLIVTGNAYITGTTYSKGDLQTAGDLDVTGSIYGKTSLYLTGTAYLGSDYNYIYSSTSTILDINGNSYIQYRLSGNIHNYIGKAAGASYDSYHNIFYSSDGFYSILQNLSEATANYLHFGNNLFYDASDNRYETWSTSIYGSVLVQSCNSTAPLHSSFRYCTSKSLTPTVKQAWGVYCDATYVYTRCHAYNDESKYLDLRHNNTNGQINSVGGNLYFQNNGTDIYWITSTGINSTDGDQTYVFGRSQIDSRTTDHAYFSHRDMATTSNYALYQSAIGATAINAATAKLIYLCINNAVIAEVASTGFIVMDGYNLYSKETYDDQAGSANLSIASAGLITRTSSAQRYKRDIDLLSGVDIIAFKPSTFRYITEEEKDETSIHFRPDPIDANRKHIGLIAEDVAKICPEAAVYKVQRDDNKTPIGYDTGIVDDYDTRAVLAITIKSLQEATKRIQILEEEKKMQEIEITTMLNDIERLKQDIIKINEVLKIEQS